MATHSNIVASRIPWAEEPDGLQSIESQGGTRPKRFSVHERNRYQLPAPRSLRQGTLQVFESQSLGHSFIPKKSLPRRCRWFREQRGGALGQGSLDPNTECKPEGSEEWTAVGRESPPLWGDPHRQNKVPQTGQLQTVGIYSLVFLEAKNAKSGCGQGHVSLQRISKRDPSLPLPDSGGCRHYLACGCTSSPTLSLHLHMTFFSSPLFLLFSGYAGSSLLCAGSVVRVHGLSFHEACGILVPQPGIEPASPALEGRFFTTEPPGKFLSVSYEDNLSLASEPIWVIQNDSES